MSPAVIDVSDFVMAHTVSQFMTAMAQGHFNLAPFKSAFAWVLAGNNAEARRAANRSLGLAITALADVDDEP